MDRRNNSDQMKAVLSEEKKEEDEREREHEGDSSEASCCVQSSRPPESSQPKEKKDEDEREHKDRSGEASCYVQSFCPSRSSQPKEKKEEDEREHKERSGEASCYVQSFCPSRSSQPKEKKDEDEREHKDRSGEASCSSLSEPPCPEDSETETCAAAEVRQKRLKEDDSSSCCPLSDLKTLAGDELGPLTFSEQHAVFVDVNSVQRRDLVPQPGQGQDMWASKHFVKMPFSPHNVMTSRYLGSVVSRWDVIFKQLTALSKKTKASVQDVEEAILKYNPKYKSRWRFDALASFVKRVPDADNYLSSLFPKIAALALKLPHYVKKPVPLLQRERHFSITLSHVQISCLLANAFFCTFPHRNTTDPRAQYTNYPTINFNSLFENRSEERKKEKLRAIMHYFHVVTGSDLKGLVTFERRVLKDKPNWRSCKEKMPKLHVSSEGSIEAEGTGLLQVDFASSWIGGGVLGSGLVQEEILFLMNPELIVSRLFTERLAENECLIVTGSQQFSCYSGYSDSFEWVGPYDDNLPRDEWLRLQRQILAIDALHFKHGRDQYNMLNVTRELQKAYCGFKGHGPDIATGKWGCGAFNGDPQLKAVIQLMAAAMARRGMAFFTFGDVKLKQELTQIHHLLVTDGTTVEKLFDLLENFCAIHQTSGGSRPDLFTFIRNTLRGPGSRSQL